MINEESYRDKISTVDHAGKRVWVYAKQSSGKLYNWRSIVAYILIAVLFVLPLIKVNGEPLFLFNIIERKFIILSVIFTVQDLHLFAISMIILLVSIVVFTVMFGRLFCGWVCPQTIFLEFVFRRIEYAIEGNANQQKKLNAQPWTIKKIVKKSTKHFLFFLIAFIIGNVFLSYIIGADQVMQIMTDPLSMHFSGFLWMLVFASLFYGVFAFMREQVCTSICPYGRLQSVLIDEKTKVVLYDWVRGEPRGRLQKNKFVDTAILSQKKGDCVDCGLCVQVCPTGIDIRNGTQLECVNCTACIDACDAVMTKINKDLGLIKIDSYENVEKGKQPFWNARAIAYSMVLLLLITAQSFLLFGRDTAEIVVQRSQGTIYQVTDDNAITNLYNYQVINKSGSDIKDLEIQVRPDFAEVTLIGEMSKVGVQENIEGAFFIKIDEKDLSKRKTKLQIILLSNGEVVNSTTTMFLGPVK